MKVKNELWEQDNIIIILVMDPLSFIIFYPNPRLLDAIHTNKLQYSVTENSFPCQYLKSLNRVLIHPEEFSLNVRVTEAHSSRNFSERKMPLTKNS